MELLDSQQASEFLSIQPSTLYAYVSRGVLESVRDPDDARRRCYRKSDLERLKRRSEATRGHGAAAAGALDWGAPVLETSISRIMPVGPEYRGHRLRELLESEFGFEDVAELLWFARLDHAPEAWHDARCEAGDLLADLSLPDDAPPVDLFRHGLSAIALRDDQRFVHTDSAHGRVGRRIVWTLAHLLVGSIDEEASIAAGLADALVDDPTEAETAAIETALITVAEHELNASTFAARVAASTDADLYACTAAALAAMAGPRHGRASQRATALLRDARRSGDPRRSLVDRLRDGDPMPGFGQPLYPAGDPRFDRLLDALRATGDPPVLATVDTLVEAAAELDLDPPNLDLGLAALTVAFDLPAGAATGLFAVGRSAGWIAHALEQYEREQLLRPRARYTDNET